MQLSVTVPLGAREKRPMRQVKRKLTENSRVGCGFRVGVRGFERYKQPSFAL